MQKLGFYSLIALALASNLSMLPAATPAIGVAISNGSVTVNNSVVPGNATLFDGNTIETGQIASRVQLKNGKLAQLGSDSRGRVYSDRLVLEKGSSETAGNWKVEANTLRIDGDSAKVSIFGKTVQVAALSAPVTVSTSTGVQVASLMPGRALAFTPQDSGALPPATLQGVVQKVGTSYVLRDETSNVTVQLVGGGVEQHVKHTVKVTGTPASGGTPVAGASQILNVTNIEMVPGAKKKAGSVIAGADDNNKKVAIIAGIAVVAALGATAGVLATQSETQSPITISPTR